MDIREKRHVLVVEDDAVCLRLVEQVLDAAGFAVTTAHDFNSAMKIIEGKEPIDVLLADVRFPAGMPHGLALGRMAQSRRPVLAVIYMSGSYNEAELAEHAPGEPALQKPFTAAQLVAAITAALH